MGLPYNPSSFASNKTILEAIEELKQYLAKNPLTSIFVMDRNWTLLTIPIEYILNPQNRDIELGDIVLSHNAYAVITDKSDSDVEVNWWNDFGETITNMTITDDAGSQEVIDPVSPFTAFLYRYNPFHATGYRRGKAYNLNIEYTNINGGASTMSVNLPIQSTINAIWYYTESDGSQTIYPPQGLGPAFQGFPYVGNEPAFRTFHHAGVPNIALPLP